MASAAGVDLGAGREEFRAGVLFSLSEDPITDASIDVDGDRLVEIHPRERVALALLRELPPPETLITAGHEAVQQALDIVAARGDGAATLPRSHAEHVAWVREDGEVTLGVMVTKEIHVSLSAQGEVRNASGEIVPPPTPPAPVWTPALRYFRLSQVAEDVYEAYRNAFLALEAILSARFPGGPGGDRAVLVWRLRQLAGVGIDLAQYVQQHGGDPVDVFFAEQYEALRCATFHAKADRPHLLPGNLTEREVIASALDPLTRLVIDVGADETNVRFRSSAMTIQGFEGLFIANWVGSLQMSLEQYDDEGVLEPDTPLDVRYIGRLDQLGEEHGFLGECAPGAIPGDSFHSVRVMHRPAEMPSPSVDFHLSTHQISPLGVDVVRVQVCFALNNRGLPRSRFTR